jgi:stage III sporulation protein SpoIIIAA
LDVKRSGVGKESRLPPPAAVADAATIMSPSTQSLTFRNVARLCADVLVGRSTVVVDTPAEIAGDGNTPPATVVSAAS